MPASKSDFVVVATFGNAAMAAIAKLHIENAGIDCFIENENVGMSLWHIQPAVGGIKLRVRADDKDTALRLLDEKVPMDETSGGPSTNNSADAEPSDTPADQRDALPDNGPTTSADPSATRAIDDTPTASTCPFCHGSDVQPFTWIRRFGQASIVLILSIFAYVITTQPAAFALGLAVVIYLLLLKPEHRCLTCRKSWIDRDVDR